MVGDGLPRLAAYMAQLLRDPEAVYVFRGKVSGCRESGERREAIIIKLMQIQIWCPYRQCGVRT